MRALLALAAAACLGLVALFLGQRALLFPAPRPPRPPDPALGDIVELATSVALWAAPPPGGLVVVHFHGNGEQLADLRDVVAALRSRGLGVLAVEYPGYGLAAGSP